VRFLWIWALAAPVLAQQPTWLNNGVAASIDDPNAPLPAEAARIANDIADENTPRPGEHYPVSNEWRHDLWFPHIHDIGGAFIGVGTDQCYTLAAVQNARIVWIVDFDPIVPLVHRMYSVFIPVSPDPAALIARFSDEEAVRSEAMLRAQLGDRAEEVLRIFRRNRTRLRGYLDRVRRVPQGGSTWLSDPQLYQRILALHRNGRVIARNGDVTANGALRAVGRAAEQLRIPLRVIYFSNAEQFFPFTTTFRENFAALYTDDRSIVLRTFRDRHATYPRNDRWHYLVEPVTDMRARIEAGYRHSRHLIADLTSHHARRMGAEGVSVLDSTVPIRTVGQPRSEPH
jgi:hypothetical protein